MTLIAILTFQSHLYSSSADHKIGDYGIISLMYHRFEENKYPSTNIRMSDFLQHLKIIEDNNIAFVNPKDFENELKNNKDNRKILLTVDDGFSSFYENAWPVLKKEKIPFILFVSTREVGAFNYMTWDQIREISKENFVEIGNHSHTHEYLVDENADTIREDIEKSISIFKKELGKKGKMTSVLNLLKFHLNKKNFFKPQEKRSSMITNINNLFYRMEPNDKELRILASIIGSLSKNKKKHN